MMGTGTNLAHAFGERYDLPIPLVFFVFGGAAVVVMSFLLVLPRTVHATDDRSAGDPPVLPRRVGVGGLISVLVLGGLVAAGLGGTQEVAENILPTVFWVLAWVAVPLLCGIVGDFTPAGNPFAVIARLTDRPGLRRTVLGGADPVRWPQRVGWWPAVALLVFGACCELIFNKTATQPAVIAIGLLAYAAVCALAGLVFGAEEWLTHGELFSVTYSTWGRLGWFRFGRPGRPGFGGGLDPGFARSASRVGFVLMLLVTVAFDGLLATPRWQRFTLGLPAAVRPGTTGFQVMSTGVLLVLALLALTFFAGFASASARVGAHRSGGVAALTGLLPSLLPIAFGYLLAHYLQYVLVNGQLVIPLLGDPAGRGWHLLPAPFNDDYTVNAGIMPSSVIWYFQLAVIVGAHIVAVVLAHRHLARTAPSRSLATRSELPWLAAMVAYTMISLWLLAQPIVAENSGGSHGQTSASAGATSAHG